MTPILGLLLIAPKARGRGLGPWFLRHLLDLARGRGCAAVYLAVLEENIKARVFWEKQGFHPTGVSAWDSATGHRAHRLGLDL